MDSFLTTYFSSFFLYCCFFFFNDTATTEIYTLSLHDALPICSSRSTAAFGSSIAAARKPRIGARSCKPMAYRWAFSPEGSFTGRPRGSKSSEVEALASRRRRLPRPSCSGAYEAGHRGLACLGRRHGGRGFEPAIRRRAHRGWRGPCRLFGRPEAGHAHRHSGDPEIPRGTPSRGERRRGRGCGTRMRSPRFCKAFRLGLRPLGEQLGWPPDLQARK